ncbi:transcriptional regulator NrdR [Modestobacter sp. VKM Ac-2983]|uniref:transcriptional regulator NrdR n=1 Tax=Modestobacter sp. VKM Ac-2983 TaxID=3004137 RepID=UPI0022ABB8EC|nr:transcriptional regulator NrdR [Modestobacter sp. VKM Ac-2983]MCZ2807670.1 transcriptional regulator NrdR [Modestobacter sp. VKM Ac-2983]
MRCPFCHNPDSRVIDSRETDEGATTRRRRSCPGCGRRFTTVEEAVLAVVKRSGVSEPFARGKVVAGVRRACQGRPVDEDQLALLAQQVEDAVRATGCAEIPSNEVGLAILGPLRDLDEVAYLRFASVYRSFSSVADFEKEIAELRAAPARGSVSAGDGPLAERGAVGEDQEMPAGGSPRRRAAERPRPADTGNAAGP